VTYADVHLVLLVGIHCCGCGYATDRNAECDLADGRAVARCFAGRVLCLFFVCGRQGKNPGSSSLKSSTSLARVRGVKQGQGQGE